MEKEQLVSTVTSAQGGDNDALNTLFNEYYNDLYYFALKTVKDDETALDVTQEAFVEIINTLGNLKEPAAFVTWAKQITYHQCTRYFKKKKDVLVDEDEEGNTVFDTLKEENAEFIPDEALDQSDFKKTVMAILDELSEEQRSATMMYYFDEMSIKQIAEIQGVSEGTVKSRLNYARKAIKNSVEEYEKKNGIKLHAIPFFPFFRWLFKGAFEGTLPTASAELIAKGVATATGTTVTVGTATASTVATTTAVGIGAKIAALPLATKIVAGVVAAAIVIGGSAAAIIGSKDEKPSDSNSATSASGDENNSSKHTHQWSEWEVFEQSFGVITYEVKQRECTSCGEAEKTDETSNTYDFLYKHFGEDCFLDKYFDGAGLSLNKTQGDFDINGLFYAGDFLASEANCGLNGEPTTQISADEYYEILKEHFALSKSVISEMKAIRPESTYTVAFDYNGANLMPGACTHKSGNIYTVYYTYSGSHASHLPIFVAEIEYNRHEGKQNKILSLKTDGVNSYDMTRFTNDTVTIEKLIENVSKQAENFAGYKGVGGIVYPSEVANTYKLFSAMDYFGYNLTEEEMFGKGWGWIDYDATKDSLSSITASLELPLLSWDSDPTEKLLSAAKRDIGKFTKLVGEDNVFVRIGDDNAEGGKGPHSITDDVIKEITTHWFGEEKICIYTAEPIDVNGKKCNLSFTISGPQGFVQSAYYISLNISFE